MKYTVKMISLFVLACFSIIVLDAIIRGACSKCRMTSVGLQEQGVCVLSYHDRQELHVYSCFYMI